MKIKEEIYSENKVIISCSWPSDKRNAIESIKTHIDFESNRIYVAHVHTLEYTKIEILDSNYQLFY